MLEFSEVFSFLKDRTENTPEKIVARHIRNIKAAMGETTPADTPPVTEKAETSVTEPEWVNFSYTDRRVIKLALDRALEAAAQMALVSWILSSLFIRKSQLFQTFQTIG